MKIALVTESFLPKIGGAEFVIHNLAKQWGSEGHEVCVIHATAGKMEVASADYSTNKYTVQRGSYRFGPHRFPFCQLNARRIQRKLDEFRPDFISGHFGYPTGLWLSCIQPLPKFLVTCHGRELTKFEWGYRNIYGIDDVLAKALNKSVGAVAISRHARHLMEEMGVQSEKILDIPNGVDVNRFQQEVNADFRNFMGLPERSLVILSVGREHPQKAYDLGIKSFSKIAPEFDNLFYVILGRGSGKWLSLVKDLGLEHRVVLSEGLSGEQLVAAYQQSDIYLSSSVWEMMPLVVLEAMAAGLPLVVTNVSGSQDIVMTGKNGFVVEPSQVEAMAEALRALCADSSLRNRLRQTNKEAATYYSWANICRMYLNAA